VYDETDDAYKGMNAFAKADYYDVFTQLGGVAGTHTSVSFLFHITGTVSVGSANSRASLLFGTSVDPSWDNNIADGRSESVSRTYASNKVVNEWVTHTYDVLYGFATLSARA